MNNSSTSSNNGFMGGFILGILVGAAAVFLLATKKGKRLLKILSEEGVEGISELEELFAENILEEKPKPVKSKKVTVVEPVGEIDQKAVKTEEVVIPKMEVKESSSNGVSSIPSAISRFGVRRRFFKGIPKRS